jgi:hypothetical protein
MSKAAAQHERRSAGRASNGDVVVCPRCNRSTLEFNARWRVFLESGGSSSLPAWVCDNADCRFFTVARREDTALELAVSVSGAARGLRARAQRKLMKSRDVRQRAERALAKSQSRRNNN